MTVFATLLAPVMPILTDIEHERTKHGNETFTWLTFVRIIVYCCTKRCRGRNEWVITCANAEPELDIPAVPRMTLSDAFQRFPPRLLRRAVALLLAQLALPHFPELALIGMLYAVDGSVFPLFNGMTLPKSSDTMDSVKLHLKFSINQLLAVDFLLSTDEAQERAALRKFLTKGATYVLDRGYMAFALLRDVIQAQAFVVMRAYTNIVVETVTELPVVLPDTLHQHWTGLRDRLVRSDHPDAQNTIFRLVEFTAGTSTYRLITNRTDLTTFQIMLLYAYRWQIELIFRFFKHTMAGMHIVSTHPWGIENYFAGLFLTAALHLQLKNACLEQEGHLPPSTPSDTIADSQQNAQEQSASITHPTIRIQESSDRARPTAKHAIACFAATVNRSFGLFWKVSKHWLSTLADYLYRPFTREVVSILNRRALYGCNRL